MKPSSEAQTQRAALDYLAAKHIWHRRMNTGAIRAEHNGKQRFVRYGTPGMADILALWFTNGKHRPVWLEIKSPTGRQSPAQKEFEREVRAEGHSYVLVRSIDQAIEFFEGGKL